MQKQSFIKFPECTPAEEESRRRHFEESLRKKQEQLEQVKKDLNLGDVDLNEFKYFYRLLKYTNHIPEKAGHYRDKFGFIHHKKYIIETYEKIIGYLQKRNILDINGQLCKECNDFEELDKKMNELEELLYKIDTTVSLIQSDRRPRIYT